MAMPTSSVLPFLSRIDSFSANTSSNLQGDGIRQRKVISYEADQNEGSIRTIRQFQLFRRRRIGHQRRRVTFRHPAIPRMKPLSNRFTFRTAMLQLTLAPVAG